MIVEINEKKDLGFKVGDLCSYHGPTDYAYITKIDDSGKVSGLAFTDGGIRLVTFVDDAKMAKTKGSVILNSSDDDIYKVKSEDGKELIFVKIFRCEDVFTVSYTVKFGDYSFEVPVPGGAVGRISLSDGEIIEEFKGSITLKNED